MTSTTRALVLVCSLLAITLLACGGAPRPAVAMPAANTPPATSDVAPPAPANAESADPNVRAVEAERRALDGCYERARRSNAALARTTVTLKLRADDTGKVTNVDLDYTHKFDEDAKACMRESAFRVKLPAGTKSASVPVVFDAGAK